MAPPQSRSSKDKEQPVSVTIVSNNPETLDGLQSYFRHAGVAARGTRLVSDSEVVAPASTAVVFFPDDFQTEQVVEVVGRLRRNRPMVLPILVTGNPKRFERIATATGKGPAPLILPKPAWGSTILDAIRGHLDVSA